MRTISAIHIFHTFLPVASELTHARRMPSEKSDPTPSISLLSSSEMVILSQIETLNRFILVHNH